MSKIAIIGAGQAGLLTAHALHQKGYQVTLYSDKTPEDFLKRSKPTGAAGRFDMALSWERELGLERWSEKGQPAEGVHLTFSLKQGNQLVTMLGRFRKPGLGVDLRLQSAVWMEELVQKGAKVEIEDVSLARLDEIAAQNDLTLVAAGKGEIRKLFARDDAKSTYTTPQRLLAMVCVNGVSTQVPYASHFSAVKFNFFAPFGEAFWMPWYAKDGTRSLGMLIEAKPNTPLDRFGGLRSGEEVLARAKEVIRELMPWDYEWLKGATLCDENSWLLGSITPEVKKVVGTLPSGRHVLALGDTAQTLDPIAGQGANNGNKMARNLVQCIVERGEGPFDAAFMAESFERFWRRHHQIDRFNNTFLEPIKPSALHMLIAQYGSTGRADDDSPNQKLANLVCENFNDPALLTDAFHDAQKARKIVREVFGSHWAGPVAKGAARIARGQLRQALRQPPGHPGMAPVYYGMP